MWSRIAWTESAAVVGALVLLEMGVLLVEIQSAIILDWFITLAPLIWINASVLVLYAFFRQLAGSSELPSTPRKRGKTWELFRTEFATIRGALRTRAFKLLWLGFGLVYAVIYMLFQGILVVDLSGRLEPLFVTLQSPLGYGPALTWAPTHSFGLLLRPYTVMAAAALSLLSGIVLSLLVFSIAKGRRSLRALPGPLAGLGVMCPACFASPATGLFLAYLAPAATLAGLGTLPLFSMTLAVSTILLIVSLIVLWMTIAWLSRTLARVAGPAESPARGP